MTEGNSIELSSKASEGISKIALGGALKMYVHPLIYLNKFGFSSFLGLKAQL